MLYQDPRVTFKSLAVRQWQALSPNRQNLVTQVLRELLQMQEHDAHASNDNPFMDGCSLFEAHSKCLSKWGIKITYGICQDKIDIVCIEVDPSPLPPSGPQAISIRSFSANDNFEFVQHPAFELRVAFSDLKKVGAWLAAAEQSYSERIVRSIYVERSFAMTMFIRKTDISYQADLPCKGNYRIETSLKLHIQDIRTCASKILIDARFADVIEMNTAIAMSSVLVGRTMRAYDESLWRLGAAWSLGDLCAAKYSKQLSAIDHELFDDIDLDKFEHISIIGEESSSSSIFTDEMRYSFETSEQEVWRALDPDLSTFSLLAAISASAGQPPCQFH